MLVVPRGVRPMKILLLGDFHYTLKQWDWLNQVAGDFDLIVARGTRQKDPLLIEPHGHAVYGAG